MTPDADNATMTLICGQLRLTVPRSAEIPSISLRPGSETVDISFTKFSGTVSFETMAASNTSSQTEAPLTPTDQPPNMLPPTLEQSLQTSIQPPAFSQSLPMSLTNPPSPSTATNSITDHFLASNQPDSIFNEYSEINSQIPASQLLDSQPNAIEFNPSQTPCSQAMQSQHPASQSAPSDSKPAESNPSDSNLSQPEPEQSNLSQPDSQFPDSHPSQSDSLLPSTPPMPHFAAETPVDVPPSPPSSHQSDDDLAPIKPFSTPAVKLGLKSHPSALARVDKRFAKHGKRVRFEDSPAILSSPPRKKLAVDTGAPLPCSSDKNEADDLPQPVVSKSQEKSKAGLSPSTTGKSKKNGPKIPKKGKAKAFTKALVSKAFMPKSLTPKLHEKCKTELLSSAGTPKLLKVSNENKSEGEPIANLQPSVEGSMGKEKPEANLQPAEKSGGALALTPVSSPGKPSPWDIVEVCKSARPAARWGATFTPLDKSSVLLVGGESEANGLFGDAVIYDVENSTWISDERRAPDMPSVRAWHSATQIDNIVFIFGGETGGGQDSQEKSSGSSQEEEDREQCNSALVYDKTYRTWYSPSLTGNAPTARAGHCAALVPGTRNVAIFGGINKNKWLSDLHILEDACSWLKPRVSTKSARPAARSYATLTTTAEFLVLFGGNNKNMCFNDVHLLLPNSMTWVEPVILGRAPKPRTGHCAVTSKDGRSVIVYGGWDDQGAKRLFFSDVWVLRIESKDECLWTCLYVGDNSSRSPGPRAGASICGGVGEEEDDTLLFGGWHQLTHFNDITRLQVGPNGRVRVPYSR